MTCCACLKHITCSEVQIIKRITSALRLFSEDKKSMGKAECPFQNWQFDWPPISVVLQSLQQNIFQNIKQWSFKDYKKCPLSIRPSTRFRKDHKDFQIKICLRPSFNCKMFHSINSTLAILTILSPCTLLTFKTSMWTVEENRDQGRKEATHLRVSMIWAPWAPLQLQKMSLYIYI